MVGSCQNMLIRKEGGRNIIVNYKYIHILLKKPQNKILFLSLQPPLIFEDNRIIAGGGEEGGCGRTKENEKPKSSICEGKKRNFITQSVPAPFFSASLSESDSNGS